MKFTTLTKLLNASEEVETFKLKQAMPYLADLYCDVQLTKDKIRLRFVYKPKQQVMNCYVSELDIITSRFIPVGKHMFAMQRNKFSVFADKACELQLLRISGKNAISRIAAYNKLQEFIK